MNRSPIVLAGTAVGLVGVLAYNTSSSPSAVVGSSASTTPQATSTSASSTTPAAAASTAASASTTATAATTSGKTRRRSATGQDVSFQYGDLAVKVTKVGTRITDVSVVQGNANDPRSQSIDQVAIPELRQEAIAAQSAKINGVSGASYTSAAYEQSLQSALDKLA